jgi:hypothetical protein
MKPRVGGRRKRRRGIPALSLPGHGAVRPDHFRGVRFLEPAAPHRPREIHRLVSVPLPSGWRDDRMGHVSLHALKHADFADKLTGFLRGCYCRYNAPR